MNHQLGFPTPYSYTSHSAVYDFTLISRDLVVEGARIHVYRRLTKETILRMPLWGSCHLFGDETLRVGVGTVFLCVTLAILDLYKQG